MIVATPRLGPRLEGWPPELESTLPAAEIVTARRAVAAWNGYRPTPVVEMPHLARRLGVAMVLLKLEGERFAPVGSFKALGPAYALERAVERAGPDAGRRAAWTAIAATSGNHGRAVAWAASRLGLRARIFMPAHTSAGREAAIRALGAQVERIAGSFDDALDAALGAAAAPCSILVADVPRPGAEALARDTLAGYAVLGDEIADGQDTTPASHVFVAAGNGSLAAATTARLMQRLGPGRPAILSVEPLASDVVRRSLAAGERLSLADPGRSLMDGLVVGTPAALAWPILAAGLDAGLAVGDDIARATLRGLATGSTGDPAIEIGETGIAAIAGLIAAAQDDTARRGLAIGGGSRLLAVVCEGVTDRAVFDALASGA